MDAVDAPHHFGDTQRSVVDLDIALDQAADQTQAHFRLFTGDHRIWPILFHDGQIDLILMAIGIDIRAWKQRL